MDLPMQTRGAVVVVLVDVDVLAEIWRLESASCHRRRSIF
jgi:hypothetical protein